MKPDCAVRIGSLKLKNPVMVASGTFGYAEEFKDFLDLRCLGAVVSKTITVSARNGNPMPRTCETPSGLLNSIGLENPGLERFLDEKLPVLSRSGVPVIVSIAAECDIKEFSTLIRALSPRREIAAFELNVSCPNVTHAGTAGLIAQDARATARVVAMARALTRKPLITKLSPNVTDITVIARAAERAGSDALALINTLAGMSIDVATRRPKIARIVAGLSGPAIRPVAVRMVWETARCVSIPVIGMGGITDAESALEFIIAGATAVSVGTENFVNPGACAQVLKGIGEYMRRNRIARVGLLRGSLCQ
jgi:dihydroorotate dehydrogenase (NAD+) catalytic subunit